MYEAEYAVCFFVCLHEICYSHFYWTVQMVYKSMCWEFEHLYRKTQPTRILRKRWENEGKRTLCIDAVRCSCMLSAQTFQLCMWILFYFHLVYFFSLSLTLPLSPSLFLSLRRSFCRFAVQTCFTFIYQAHFVQLRSIRFKCYFCRSMSFSHSNAIFYRVRTHSRKSCHRSINSYF